MAPTAGLPGIIKALLKLDEKLNNTRIRIKIKGPL
jgi:hypothetical protein